LEGDKNKKMEKQNKERWRVEKMSEENIPSGENNVNDLEKWVKVFATYFPESKLQGFFEKEDCSKILLGSVPGEDLANKIVSRFPSFRVCYEKAKKKEKSPLFGGNIKGSEPASDLYDIFVEKI